MLPEGFFSINGQRVFGLPITGFYVLALALVAVVPARIPADRPLLLRHRRQSEGGGAERHSGAALHHRGLRHLRHADGAWPALLASKLRIGQASVGLEFLLPALVGAFLGSTTIKPGRVNVWGTLVGVIILAIGISGIQQFGGSFWVEPMFNGVTLLVAIGIAGYAQRKRGASARPLPHGAARRNGSPRRGHRGRNEHEAKTRFAGRHVAAAGAAGRDGRRRADDLMDAAKAKVAAATQKAGRLGRARPPARRPRRARPSSMSRAT